MKSLGIDIGKRQDPSAAVGIEDKRGRLHVYAGQRLPLGMDYSEQIDLFCSMAELVDLVMVDCGGPGWPVIDSMRGRGVDNIWAVSITSGGKINLSPDVMSMTVPKTALINNLSLAAEKKILTFGEGLGDLADEMRSFDYMIMASGHVKMEASAGHDDIVLAAALACLGHRMKELLR